MPATKEPTRITFSSPLPTSLGEVICAEHVLAATTIVRFANLSQGRILRWWLIFGDALHEQIVHCVRIGARCIAPPTAITSTRPQRAARTLSLFAPPSPTDFYVGPDRSYLRHFSSNQDLSYRQIRRVYLKITRRDQQLLCTHTPVQPLYQPIAPRQLSAQIFLCARLPGDITLRLGMQYYEVR